VAKRIPSSRLLASDTAGTAGVVEVGKKPDGAVAVERDRLSGEAAVAVAVKAAIAMAGKRTNVTTRRRAEESRSLRDVLDARPGRRPFGGALAARRPCPLRPVAFTSET